MSAGVQARNIGCRCQFLVGAGAVYSSSSTARRNGGQLAPQLLNLALLLFQLPPLRFKLLRLCANDGLHLIQSSPDLGRQKRRGN